MRQIYLLESRTFRDRDGTPLLEVALHSHDGEDVQGSPRRPQVWHFFANAEQLDAIVEGLADYAGMLRRMPSLPAIPTEDGALAKREEGEPHE